MAFKQEYIDRYKAEGFYRHLEWNRKRGVLVKVFDKKPEDRLTTISFESGTHDLEYDQRFEGYRMFFLTRKEAVEFMVNIGFRPMETALTFKMIDGMQVVTKHV